MKHIQILLLIGVLSSTVIVHGQKKRKKDEVTDQMVEGSIVLDYNSPPGTSLNINLIHSKYLYYEY